MRLTLMIICTLALLLSITRGKAQRFDAPPLALDGPYAVGTIERTITDEERPLTLTVWYPSNGENAPLQYPFVPPFSVDGFGSRDAEPVQDVAPFPLVIFSHGSGGSRVLSLFLTEHLASQGFVVMAADHPGNGAQETVLGQQDFATNYALRPDDILRQIDYAADVLNVDEGFLAGKIDMERVGVIGHSFGGWTALAASGGRLDFTQLDDYCDQVSEDNNVCFVAPLKDEIAAIRGLDTTPQGPWNATTDTRIKAVIALAPWNAPLLNVNAVAIPSMIIVGSEDTTTPAERDADVFYAQLPAPRSLVTLELGGHYLFVDECPDVLLRFGAQDVCTDPVWDMTRAHDIIRHMTTAFMRQYLMNDDEAASYLAPESINFTGVRYQTDG